MKLEENNKRILYPCILVLLLIFSFFLRYPSFYLPHNNGDQIHYLSLAMKIEERGFKGYNLKDVNIQKSSNDHFMRISASDEGSRGNLLNNLPAYYDQALFYKPPLFIYTLSVFHRLFSNDKEYYVVNTNLGRNVRNTRPPAFFKAQFYCTIVPIFFCCA